MSNIDINALPDNTPILVGAGQIVEQTGSDSNFSSSAELASKAAQAALDDAGITDASTIDSIAVVRLFSDSPGAWECPYGRSNNLPQSIAERIGAQPKHRIYSETGGNMPQQLVTEMAQAIASGEKSTVLLAGVETIGHQNFGQRNGMHLEWEENYQEPLEDRGHGKRFVTHDELANGLWMPIYYYSLIENALAARLGHDTQQHRQAMAELLAPISETAANNPYSQFPTACTAEQLCSEDNGNYQLTNPYLKKLVAQDAVNQSAALLLTSIGEAKRLGIPSSQWVFLHGFAQGYDHPLYIRPELDKSAAQVGVLDKTMAMAGMATKDIDLFEIYSCFPCAVSTVADALELPKDGSIALTLTGGLAFFGGAGNNYSMHGIAEMVTQLRARPDSHGLVTTNGGFLSKHASCVYSCKPSALDWQHIDHDEIRAEDIPCMASAQAPSAGSVLSYTVIYKRGEAQNAIIIGETEQQERFVATTVDADLIANIENKSPIGRTVTVTTDNDANTFFLNP